MSDGVFLVWGINYMHGGGEESTLLSVHSTQAGADAVLDAVVRSGERFRAASLEEWAEVDFDAVEGPDHREVLA